MNILMIGNSYTYFADMPQILKGLLRENGIPAQVDSVTCGGRKLYENLNPEDAYHKRIVGLCREQKYDALILQEQSYFGLADYEKFAEGVQGCAELVSAKRTVLYATWGRAQGSELLVARGWTSEGMTLSLADAYARVADGIGADCAHVGKCFAAIGKAYPEIGLYDPDLSHPSYAGSCTAALALYKNLIGSLPTDTASLKLDAATVKQLCAVIDSVV